MIGILRQLKSTSTETEISQTGTQRNKTPERGLYGPKEHCWQDLQNRITSFIATYKIQGHGQGQVFLYKINV